MSTENKGCYNVFELCWGLVMMLLAAYVYSTSIQFPSLPGNPVGPGTFPSLISAILFPCGLFILVRNALTYFKLRRQSLVGKKNVSGLGIFVLVVSVPVSNILFAELLGFTITSILATTLLMSVMRKGNILSSFVISCIAVTGFYWIFTDYLLVPLPTGTLFQ
ncbi:tripartite tricarboxylate transporter TctB family protein [Vibrio vulnificus]|nr:tripartite tricarboxylate transporter TctB family protein [Vibrio vulnificus]HAS8263253.1 tripartite tricarboxylate transporter TctB family protein [Vibrio vulnificus]